MAVAHDAPLVALAAAEETTEETAEDTADMMAIIFSAEVSKYGSKSCQDVYVNAAFEVCVVVVKGSWFALEQLGE